MVPAVDVGAALGGPSLLDDAARGRLTRAPFLENDSLLVQVVVPMVLLLVVLGLVLALMG